MTREDSHSTFISYASPDRERVLPFYEWLEKQGFDVWMDCRRLKPGQNWSVEINRALDKATFIISFVSRLSFDRRGYLQRELKLALDKVTEKLVDDIYLIPVLLDDDVEIPNQIKHLHFIRANEPNCKEQIVGALNHQLERLGIESREIQEKEEVYWTFHVKREEWDGIPGYEVELQFMEFRSDRYRSVPEIGEYIKGTLLPNLFRHRADKLIPQRELFNYGQDRFSRTNTFDAHCNKPSIVGKVISIQYTIDWYGAGAAHPNHHFQTYSFTLEPLILIEALKDIFQDPDTALDALRAQVREQLYQVRVSISDDDDDETQTLDSAWIDRGTEHWENFDSFVFRPDAIEILFAPYDVTAYAFGPQSAKIPYTGIVTLMRTEYVSALEIQHLALRSR
jgi:hypothetical protein